MINLTARAWSACAHVALQPRKVKQLFVYEFLEKRERDHMLTIAGVYLVAIIRLAAKANQ